MNQRPCKILLYGATGYSGRLIAAEGEYRGRTDGGCRMILAARDRNELSKVAAPLGMEWRCFGLDHPEEVVRHLEDLGVDVVLNAAGPFGQTAERLAQAAIAARCHYVDINGEVEWAHRVEACGDFVIPSDRVEGRALVLGFSYANGDDSNGNIQARWLQYFDL